MNSKRIVLGIGIVLLVLVVLTAHAAAENRVYFVPQHSNASTGEYAQMDAYLDLGEGETLHAGQLELLFDTSHGKVEYAFLNCPEGEGNYCWNIFSKNETYADNGYMWSFTVDPLYWETVPYGRWEQIPGAGCIHGPTTVYITTFWVKAVGTPGVTPINFGFEYTPSGCPICQESLFGNCTGTLLDINWENGTFTHKGQSETFTTSLDLGWNLISLPLTPEGASTSAVLGNGTIAYDHVYKYTSNQFVDVTSGTMEAGVGYFVNVTTAGTWSYNGTAYDAMSVPLSQGLNCIGWTNTSADIPGGALDSIAGDYRYVARWNTAEQKYELYDAMAPSGVPEFIDFTTMERGVGYFIATTAGCTLTYP